jgi:prepilin-type processing-associated H-X9-DG protein
MGLWSIRRLMVLIAGIAVLLGGLMGLQGMFEPQGGGCGYRTQCASNVRNIVCAVLLYANREGSFPSGTWPNPNLPPERRLSWYAAILPDIENPELWDSLDKDRAWDDPSNDLIANSPIGVLRCPVLPPPPASIPVLTPFIGIAGLGTDAPSLPKGHPRAGVFGYDRQTTLQDLRDGAAYTMVVAESGRVRGRWLAGGPATVRGLDTADLPYLGPRRQFGGIHPEGANVAFADGAVRFIPDTIDPKVFEALSTIAGGEKVPQIALESP